MWLSLLVAALAVTVSLYAALWSVILALWAVFASLAVCGPAGIAAGVVFALGGEVPSGIAAAGAGVVCAGLAVFVFFGCRAATKGVLKLTKRLAVRVKSGFVKKEEVL